VAGASSGGEFHVDHLLDAGGDAVAGVDGGGFGSVVYRLVDHMGVVLCWTGHIAWKLLPQRMPGSESARDEAGDELGGEQYIDVDRSADRRSVVDGEEGRWEGEDGFCWCAVVEWDLFACWCGRVDCSAYDDEENTEKGIFYLSEGI
jgi:hypothetical protein